MSGVKECVTSIVCFGSTNEDPGGDGRERRQNLQLVEGGSDLDRLKDFTHVSAVLRSAVKAEIYRNPFFLVYNEVLVASSTGIKKWRWGILWANGLKHRNYLFLLPRPNKSYYAP